MPAMIELRTTQKRMLFMLMKLERDNPGIKIAGLRDQIIAFQTEMEQEDVALVEKMIAAI